MPTSSPSLSPLTLDDLVLLTEEFRDLVRAGVPLDLGFRTTAQRMPRRVRRLTEELADQLQQGATLRQAMAALGDSIPGTFRTLIEVGARTGRLEETLRSLSAVASAIRDMQKTLASAAIYPAILLALGYGLLIVLAVVVIPQMVRFYQDLRVSPPIWIRAGIVLQENVVWWAGGLPLVAGLLLLGLRVVRPSGWQPVPDLAGLGRFLPGMSRAIQETEIARLGQLLALLVDARVPLPEALPLVAQGVNDPALRQWCLTEASRAGSGDAAPAPPGRIPALMQWYIGRGNQDGELGSGLRQMADLYRERALARMDRMVHFWPVAMTLAVGVSFIGIFATTTFGTIFDLWRRLGQ